eukprot:3940745-Rhodomonas_salina.30
MVRRMRCVPPVRTLCYRPTHVQYCPSRCCYAMSGTDLAYAATSWRSPVEGLAPIAYKRSTNTLRIAYAQVTVTCYNLQLCGDGTAPSYPPTPGLGDVRYCMVYASCMVLHKRARAIVYHSRTKSIREGQYAP